MDGLRGEIRGAHVTPGTPAYIGPKRPMDVESYRQEQIYRGKQQDALTQAERDAGRLARQRPDTPSGRTSDQRQLEMQIDKDRSVER